MLLEGRDLAKYFNCKFIETSAKQRINVDEAFSNLVREIRRFNKVRFKTISSDNRNTNVSFCFNHLGAAKWAPSSRYHRSGRI